MIKVIRHDNRFKKSVSFINPDAIVEVTPEVITSGDEDNNKNEDHTYWIRFVDGSAIRVSAALPIDQFLNEE